MLGACIGVASLAGGSLAGCGFGSVEVAPHSVRPDAEQVCAAFIGALPEVVDDAVRRDVEPPQAGVAAWGQPPIIARCGVDEPPGLDPTSAVLDLSGVEWRSAAGEGGTFFYLDGRAVVVEVAIPDDYAPEAEVLVDLADAVRDTVPLLDDPLLDDPLLDERLLSEGPPDG